MSNIASLLKSEIIRLSKKVVRENLSSIQSATMAHRRQLTELKKQVHQLEREVAQLRRVAAKSPRVVSETTNAVTNRFVAKGLRSLRVRLGLSAEDFGRLVGVGGQTIYNWEGKKTTPNSSQVAAIAQLRKLGKRDARKRLLSLAE